MITALRLTPYDPLSELKERAARAVAMFTKEYDLIEDPGVSSSVDRLKVNAMNWRKSPTGRATIKRRKENMNG